MMKPTSKNGTELIYFAKIFILNNEAEAVLKTLEDALQTDCRKIAALELCNYYFKKMDYKNFLVYYDLLSKEEDNLNVREQVKRMKLYLSCKLLTERKEQYVHDYFESQIVSYSEEKSISYIREKNMASWQNGKILNRYQPKEIIEKAQPYLTEKKRMDTYDAFDQYDIEVKDIGVVNNQLSSTLALHTIHNTFDIVSMHPTIRKDLSKILVPKKPILLHKEA